MIYLCKFVDIRNFYIVASTCPDFKQRNLEEVERSMTYSRRPPTKRQMESLAPNNDIHMLVCETTKNVVSCYYQFIYFKRS